MKQLEKLANLIFPDVTETVADLEKKYPSRELADGAMVTRFAPSPTGFLHSGSLFAAMISDKFAKQSNGVFFLRLEDTDQKREIKGSGNSLISQLKSFGVHADEGYFGDDNESGKYGPYVQSKREDIYKIVLKELIIKGLVYPCFCTTEELTVMREKQQAKKENFGYYGEYAKCSFLSTEEYIKKINNNESFVLRFRSSGNYHNKISFTDAIRGNILMAENDQHIVVMKSDGLPTYHFAHLVDDHFMHTTHVTRGEEWLPSVPIHLELFKAMNWEAPVYAHLPVIMKLDDGKRRKLSKRKDPEAATSYFLEKGYPVDAFMEYLYTIANSNFEEWRIANPSLDRKEFMFSFDKMSLDGALFDLEKISSLSKDCLGGMSTEIFAKNCYNFAKEYDSEFADLIESDYTLFQKIVSIERDQEKPRKDYEKYSDVMPLILFYYDDFYSEMVKSLEMPEQYTVSQIKEVVSLYTKDLNLDVDEEEWFAHLKALALENGYAKNAKKAKKNPELYKGSVADFAAILRLIITLRAQSPNLYFVMKILGKEKVVSKLNNYANSL